MGSFSVERDRRCQRGLRHDYHLDPMPAVANLVRAIREEFDHLVVGEESYGQRKVIRLILQFQLEFRLGERDASLTVLHRVCSGKDQRAENERRLERLLEASFELHRAPATPL